MNNWKKKFIIIWSGQLFSILSSSIAQFSIVLWISLKTGSAEVLSFAMIAALLPQALLGAFAGVYVDRWNRKWTVIGADSFVALCSGVHRFVILLGCSGIVAHLYIIGASFHWWFVPFTGNEIIYSIAGSGKGTDPYCGN